MLQAVWADAVAGITAGDSGGKRTITVPSWDGDGAAQDFSPSPSSSPAALKLKNVVVGVLPATVSRHNCPAAPFAVSNILAGVSTPGQSNKTLGVVTFLSHAAHAMPTAAAVARAFPLYNAKSTKDRAAPESRGFVPVKGGVLVAAAMVPERSSGSGLVEVPAGVAAAAAAAAGGVRLAARLVDTPPSVMDPDQLVREAEAVAAALNALSGGAGGGTVTSSVLRYDALKAGGFGALVAVGDAAARDGREPALVHLTYPPPPSPSPSPSPAPRKVALVGKGITFDTGGLQIKGGAGMCGMKTDMGGAAAMLGAFRALVTLRPTNIELHLVLCIAENAVGAAAFRPDDVVTAFSGRTVEINNTDAEGRLVLADGVAYASGGGRGTTHYTSNFKPSTLNPKPQTSNFKS